MRKTQTPRFCYQRDWKQERERERAGGNNEVTHDAAPLPYVNGTGVLFATATRTHTNTEELLALSVLCHSAWHWRKSVAERGGDCTAAPFLSSARVRLSDSAALIYDSRKQTQPADMMRCVCVCAYERARAF